MAPPKEIHGRGKDPHHKKLVRVTFWTPYPTRSGTILSRVPNITVGQEVVFSRNPDTYIITGCKSVNTPVFGLVNEYTFTASPRTVKQWTNRLRLEEKRLELVTRMRSE